jgi:hypothetical protein
LDANFFLVSDSDTSHRTASYLTIMANAHSKTLQTAQLEALAAVSELFEDQNQGLLELSASYAALREENRLLRASLTAAAAANKTTAPLETEEEDIDGEVADAEAAEEQRERHGSHLPQGVLKSAAPAINGYANILSALTGPPSSVSGTKKKRRYHLNRHHKDFDAAERRIGNLEKELQELKTWATGVKTHMSVADAEIKELKGKLAGVTARFKMYEITHEDTHPAQAQQSENTLPRFQTPVGAFGGAPKQGEPAARFRGGDDKEDQSAGNRASVNYQALAVAWQGRPASQDAFAFIPRGRGRSRGQGRGARGLGGLHEMRPQAYTGASAQVQAAAPMQDEGWGNGSRFSHGAVWSVVKEPATQNDGWGQGAAAATKAGVGWDAAEIPVAQNDEWGQSTAAAALAGIGDVWGNSGRSAGNDHGSSLWGAPTHNAQDESPGGW